MSRRKNKPKKPRFPVPLTPHRTPDQIPTSSKQTQPEVESVKDKITESEVEVEEIDDQLDVEWSIDEDISPPVTDGQSKQILSEQDQRIESPVAQLATDRPVQIVAESAAPPVSVVSPLENGEQNDSKEVTKSEKSLTKTIEGTAAASDQIKQLEETVQQLQRESDEAKALAKELQNKIDTYQSESKELERLRQDHSRYRVTTHELEIAKTEVLALKATEKRLLKLVETEQIQRDQLAQQAEKLARKERQLFDLEGRLEEISETWQPERVKELELQVEALKRQINKLEEIVTERETEIEHLQSELREFNLGKLAALQELNASLSTALEATEKELQTYLTFKPQFIEKKSLLKRAGDLEQQNRQLLEEKVLIEKELAQLQAQLSQQAAYLALVEKVKLDNNELRQEIEILNDSEKRRQQRGERAFEALQELINNPNYNKPFTNKTKTWPGDSEVVKQAKEMAARSNFHFSVSQLRTFLAAIRSARLIILKGFSGLGKTSLPILFARAIGAPCEIIPVQPSWRSKVDLLGFFNHFEQRFLPTQFTKALFKAQLPAFQNRHFFIVLDEMNLARVEYYFSDFNVKLEDSNNPLIELFDQASVGGDLLNQRLSHYIKFGNQISIPRNVTFVGTINDDETTFAISDKIYDRAQVIDFFEASEQSGHGVLPSEQQSLDPLSFSDSLAAWEQAQLSDKDIKAIDHFLTQISEDLRERFYLSLSYRPRRQIRDFIRAYHVLGGGDKSEALDLQIISKVIPKIRYSHRADFEEAVDQFGEKLQKLWPYDGKGPNKTKERLELLKKQG